MTKFYTFFVLLLIFSCTSKVDEINSEEKFKAFVENFNVSSNSGDISDLGIASFATELENTRNQLKILMAIDTSQLSFEDKIDWSFAQSILKGKEVRQSKHESWKRDPRDYMQFRSLDNLIGKPGDLTKKAIELEKRLRLVPIQLANGKAQLETYVPRFQELGLFMAESARGLFNKDLPDFISKLPNNNLENLVKSAGEALEDYVTYLSDELPKKTQGDFAMGKEAYNTILANELLLDYDDTTLWEFGNMKFKETIAELEALAKEIDPSKTWQELAVEIKNEYPEPHEMIAAHQLWVDSAKAHILRNKLIPLPWNEQVKVVPRVEYLRKTSYYGNFSRAKGKDADSIFTAQWMINPFEDQWDDKTKQEYLVEHDWGVIIVTAPHEAYGGHHVQGLYQLHNPRKLRRENGLSLFSEGWGLYNEQLMSETGFFPDKRIHLRQLQLRLWRNARVIYDVGMHSGRLTYEQAISIMTDKVGFLRWAAQLEIDSSAARPGYFIGYYMGMTEILKMREMYKQKMGDSFSLSDFHEKLLKIGNMPPKLMEESLLE
ncbi:DUF885 domain-containing protein [Maribacter sp. HTCC2170]|uniref:DUF885 domain-containing protein n=1 Tax=Maribacter sp. (strain HTCC2170 / KCCM 42371) TaxID=313603 RepID=UPI00006B47F9|nr:DUF885 domain-containing protein [Maribacter sp. HTCC2170]EAR01961.1 hypothetical protein FB2170_15573 [Maribacter sp. HTCC2170]